MQPIKKVVFNDKRQPAAPPAQSPISNLQSPVPPPSQFPISNLQSPIPQSTGPTSPAGKARSSQNALKHGFFSQSVVLRRADAGESQEDFDALFADLVADLQPVGRMETTIVERLAACYWRFRRAHRFENALIEPEPPPGPREIAKMRKKLVDTRQELADLRHLESLYAKPETDLAPAEKAALDQWQEEFDRGIGKSIAHFGVDRDARDVLKTNIHIAEESIAELTDQLDAIDHPELAPPEPPQSDPSAFLPGGDDLMCLLRYEALLDRQIHRALHELHRLQARRDSHRPGPRRRPAQEEIPS